MNQVSWQFPEGFVRMRSALYYWENEGRWDHEKIDWIKVRDNPHELRNALAEGRLTAHVMTEQGKLDPVPTAPWRGNYLWAETYSTGLVKVDLERGRTVGYLCVKREDIELLWALKNPQKGPRLSLSSDASRSLSNECPTIGLVVAALTGGKASLPKKQIDGWLLENWPKQLPAALPDKGGSSVPSIARQINRVIRGISSVAATWKDVAPSDPVAAELATSFPILCAALEVFRRARSGDFDSGPSRLVLPSRVEAEIRKLVAIEAESKGSKSFLETLSRIAVPLEKVAGGGRRR